MQLFYDRLLCILADSRNTHTHINTQYYIIITIQYLYIGTNILLYYIFALLYYYNKYNVLYVEYLYINIKYHRIAVHFRDNL